MLALRARVRPRQTRRLRLQRQQLRCCGCLALLGVALVASVLMAGRLRGWAEGRRQARLQAEAYRFPLELEVEGKQFLRYQLVPITLRLQDSQGKPIVTEKPPVLTVWFEGEPVTTVGNLQKLQPRYRPGKQDYACNWPVPWMARPGTYIVQARVELNNPAEWRWAEPPAKKRAVTKPKPPPEPAGEVMCTAQAAIQVVQRTPPPFPVGTCFATWEMDFPNGPVAKPRGGKGDWRAMIDWCEYMGADTLLFRGAYTSSQGGAMTKGQPFVQYGLDAVPALAAEAHHRGLRFGVWAIAYETFPFTSNVGKPPYQYAEDISRTTGQTKELDFISLLDEQRIRDLAAFAAQMQADPNVDLVGLDYLRSDRGGYEMTDAFTGEMPVKLPLNWAKYNKKQRWQFMANKIEKEWQTDRDFYEQWNWWRAHRAAQIVESIIRQAQLQKPLYVFALSWKHGVQHGQDPAMFNDAGVSVLLPMLYQMPSQQHFEWTMGQWREYMRPGQANLAPGDQVDFFWHQKSLSPAGPELMYQRLLAAQKRMIAQGKPVGAFWHDISRAAVKGRLGPYPGAEWALAGAAAFSQVRQAWAVYPLRFTLAPLPAKARFGIPVRARVTVENVSGATVENVALRLEDTSGVKAAGAGRKTIPSLGPGEKIEVPLDAVVTTPNGARANRFMICLRVEWPRKDYGKAFRNDLPAMFVLMQYVRFSASGG